MRATSNLSRWKQIKFSLPLIQLNFRPNHLCSNKSTPKYDETHRSQLVASSIFFSFSSVSSDELFRYEDGRIRIHNIFPDISMWDLVIWWPSESIAFRSGSLSFDRFAFNPPNARMLSGKALFFLLSLTKFNENTLKSIFNLRMVRMLRSKMWTKFEQHANREGKRGSEKMSKKEANLVKLRWMWVWDYLPASNVTLWQLIDKSHRSYLHRWRRNKRKKNTRKNFMFSFFIVSEVFAIELARSFATWKMLSKPYLKY